jgi:hypothetical protein
MLVKWIVYNPSVYGSSTSLETNVLDKTCGEILEGKTHLKGWNNSNMSRNMVQ